MKILLKIAKVVGIIFAVLALLYALMWIPVVDRVINPCKHYPDLLIDCKE